MIQSNRDQFIALHTTPDVKSALKEEAAKRNISQSRLMHEMLILALQKLGYPVSGFEYRIIT